MNDRHIGQNRRLEKIARYLRQLRFKKKLFGVDEADVWKKIEKLNEMYEAAILAERDRYDILLAERTRDFSDDPELIPGELRAEYEEF